MCTLVSSSGLIWKPASKLTSDAGFQMYSKMRIGFALHCGLQFPYLWLSGNHRWNMIQTPFSDVIYVSKPSCSIFYAPVSNLTRFWGPVFIMLWTKVSRTVLIWENDSAKYWTPVCKKGNLKTSLQKVLCVGPPNLSIWKAFSNMYWMPVSRQSFDLEPVFQNLLYVTLNSMVGEVAALPIQSVMGLNRLLNERWKRK